MKKRAFTLVELLVVIAIIALLMGILMPALARVRQIAYRMVCGTNLSGIGKAMMLYANDYDEAYPMAGGRNQLLATTVYWSTTGDLNAGRGWYGIDSDAAYGRGGTRPVTITSSLYLLVKYADLTPKQFLCKGDIGTSEFTMGEASNYVDELVEAWDFGANPGSHCSYSYHMPYSDTARSPSYPLSAISPPDAPVCADRSPFLDTNAEYAVDAWSADDGVGQNNDNSLRDEKGYLNAAAHQREGQNVLYNDSHVDFTKKSDVGIENDNIWMYWGEEEYQVDDKTRMCGGQGLYPKSVGDTQALPWSIKDALLVNEPQNKP